ncbi:hypothetical protein RhiirA1_439691 [Rhizophagus irregularis]|uniref:F-box domain-containing protein n=3 Tax=Rhizophagus irregularis TaxID=588596 RepID=A0A2I1E0X6_9GLOM|nr:hypothetical protein GLOIN_2v1498239 [Rhizophagus irregularis DAOM 181602=DAOM 197198]EXX59626.1 hypothetical protein RirG_187570 [Rhizophagus irregularis DAOM 197198w]PKC69959.1 hypothetical protein RhiirA1_439691 [Rhizophagus irregularis]PKY15783.1 hypothetical protein RhiirB3_466942 [Rhizophagus irregularis]POG82395.1 hypothetical protein GLOIN_2v1498239 [Rhizophagus irregularis DAOM 181602=DAOM 197198]UZO01679.1 hypothetical protein OCT59_020190 [Rhizophagus irregularis]|eukprot:XP_025189261.1 hypothetical protein GLOIN_2v1498239 [Rhizophagus irregularis DAOM 181602=DAOM 197198]
MSSILPEDCLFNIFECLRNDFRSLNSCVRVNRIWNACVIPMLWSNPWVIEEINNKVKSQKGQVKLIDVFISALPQQSRSLLQQSELVLPTLSQPLIYNYVSFMRILNISYFEDSIWNWVTNQKIKSLKEFMQKVELVTLHLLQLILKDSKIRKFITYYVSCNKTTLLHLVNIITKTPEIGSCFSHLQEIECDSTIPIISEVFEMLIPHCKEFKRIVIKKYKDSKELANLITAQSNLQDVIIYHDNYNFLMELENQKVFEAIRVQSKSLVRLELCSFDFPIHVLGEFENLEELKLFRYGSVLTTQDNLISLSKISLKRLKKVSFYNWFLVHLGFFASFFEHTNEELREIIIGPSYSIVDRQNTGKLISSIGIHCPKLVTLEVPASPEDGQQVKNLLESCDKIEKIVIYNIKLNSPPARTGNLFVQEPEINSSQENFTKEPEQVKENLLQIFTNHFSPNLNSLSISGIGFPIKDIETFLEYRSSISRPILFYLTFGIDKKITNLLNKYKKKGILIEDEKYFSKKKPNTNKIR